MSRPLPKWRVYQSKAAEFFEALGLRATVDATLDGVRSTHNVDVLVKFDLFGVNHLWIVECKDWNRRVPKERVETLKSIVSETGADRGFMLCEKSFQSGAITAARLSNITLTSLEDLRANAEADLMDLRWNDRLKRWFHWEAAWHRIPTRGDIWPSLVAHGHSMAAVQTGLSYFRAGRFPAPYAAVTDWDNDTVDYLRADSPGAFLDGATATISAAEDFLKEHAA